MIRKATAKDIDAISAIYEAIHDKEEAGQLTTGWVRGIYPTRKTAEDALCRGDLFVSEDDGAIVGSAIINHHQEDCYPLGDWQYDVPDEKIMVIHTMVIDQTKTRKGYAKELVQYYFDYAAKNGCTVARFDTGVTNDKARSLYASMGCREVGIVPIEAFHGVEGGRMVLLEKKL